MALNNPSAFYNSKHNDQILAEYLQTKYADMTFESESLDSDFDKQYKIDIIGTKQNSKNQILIALIDTKYHPSFKPKTYIEIEKIEQQVKNQILFKTKFNSDSITSYIFHIFKDIPTCYAYKADDFAAAHKNGLTENIRPSKNKKDTLVDFNLEDIKYIKIDISLIINRLRF